MDKKNISIGAAGLLLGILASWLLGIGVWRPAGPIGGVVPSGSPIENYVPAVRYANGLLTFLETRLRATTTIDTILGIGTTTPQISPNPGSIVLDGSGTTTIEGYSSTAGKGTCIQLRTTDNRNVRIYASSSPLASLTIQERLGGLIFEAGLCQ